METTPYCLPGGQTSGQRSAWPSRAGSLGSPRNAERTHTPAGDGDVTKKTNRPHLHLHSAPEPKSKTRQ